MTGAVASALPSSALTSNLASTVAVFGDSLIGLPGDLGIASPGGEIPVLLTGGFDPSESLAATIPLEASTLTTFTAVWDLWLETLPDGFLALLQTDQANTTDGDLFVRSDGGLGISGVYDGSVPAGQWTRIAITLEDLGNGTSTLSKYIDGALAGRQTVDTARYTLRPNTDLLLLSDENGETGPAALAHFGIAPSALSDSEVAALNGVDPTGPFDPPVPDMSNEPEILPVRLTDEVNSVAGGAFTNESVATAGLTFESNFSFRIVTQSGAVADGITFQIQTERDGFSLLGDTAGGFLGLPEAPFPGVTVVFDTWPNAFDTRDNQIRILVGGDADSEPLAEIDAPVLLGSGATLFAWVEYDGTNLQVFISETDTKPQTPVLDEPVDLTSVLGETAKFGFSGATGGSTSVHDILSWELTTNAATGPDGQLLSEDQDAIDLLGVAERLAAIDFDPEAPLQLGFDNLEPTSEFGFSAVTLDDQPTVENPIDDRLIRTSETAQSFDLAEVFGAGATDFAVTTSNGEVVAAEIEDGTLTLTPGDLGHSDILVTAVNANGAVLEDNFRAIVAGENAYVFAIIPDTQDYTSNLEISATFGTMTDWLVDQKDSLAIEHVIHVGDIVQFGAESQWLIAEDAMERLDGELSYTLAIGNHDQQRPGFASAFSFETDVDTYFTPEQVGATPAQGGGLYDGFDVGEDTFGNGNTYSDSIRNSYTTLETLDGTKWLIFSLEFGMPDDVLRWASEVIEDHLDHRVIIDTHSWQGGDGRVTPTTEPLTTDNDGWGYAIRDNPRGINGGEDAWRELASKYPNMSFTFNGHNFMGGAETTVSYASGGNPVHQMFVNYQNGALPNDPSFSGTGGDGALRLVVIDPDNDRFTTHTKVIERDSYYNAFPDHEEVFEGVDLGTPEQIAIAKAGDTVITQATDRTATVALDPSETLLPDAAEPFTIAVIPDTQVYAYAYATRDNPLSTTPATAAAFPALSEFVTEPGIMQEQADWLIDNAEALNLQLVTHVGDVTQGTLERDEAAPQDRAALPEHSLEDQWTYAGDVYASIRDAGIPVSLAIGNHDDSEDGYNDTALWSATFGAESGFFGGEEGFLGFSANDRNSARLIEIGNGQHVLHLSLDYLETTANLAERAAFAQAQIDANPGVPTIITTHKNIDETGTFQSSGQDLLDTIVTPNPQVELVVSGHYVVSDFFPALLEDADGSAEQVVVTQNAAGEDVYHVIQNYQGGTPLDSGYLRLFQFDTVADTVTVSTYSPVNDEFRTGDETAFGDSEPFPFGTTASFTLPIDLGGADDVTYEWFAADGEKLGETDGAPLEADLPVGVHRLSLVVTDGNGNVSTDDKVVIVESAETLLTETFDDGVADGWIAPGAARDPFDLNTDLGFGLPSISGIAQIPVTLDFASSFRPYDDMTGEVLVSFDDGATFSTLLTLDTPTLGGNSVLDRANEMVSLEALAPNSASSVQFAWRLSEGGNDWWWAIDTINVSGPGEEVVTEFWSENFDGLTDQLQTAVDEPLIAPDLLGWTHTTPDGWTRTVDAPQGTTEWQGWSFATPEFWLAADTQDRASFTKGAGVIAIADPDEWDDFNTGTITGDDFNTALTTAAIALGGRADAGELDLRFGFDSSFRPYDAMTGEVLVSFDGGEFTSLLTLDTSTVPGGTSALTRANETVALDLVAPQGTQEVQFRFEMRDGGNDWWWAFDNLSLSSVATEQPVLLSEDFDDLPLDPFVSRFGGTGADFTNTPPDGWTRDNTNLPIDENFPEYQGWSFLDKDSWISEAGNQDRTTFTLGEGTVAVADPDQYDDRVNVDPNLFDASLITPPIDITAIGGGQPGGEAAGVARFEPLTPNEGILVTPAASGRFDAYTIIFDLYLPEAGATSFTALYQTDVTNSGDADIYIRSDGGIGISGVYEGQSEFGFDAWNRIALTFSVEGTAQVLRKYVNGTLVGTQTVTADVTGGSRWSIDADTGFLLFSEPNSFTSELFANAVTFTPEVLDDDAIAALGGVDVDGPLDGSDNADAFELSFDGALDAVDFGTATVESVDLGQGDLGSYLVKGSIFGNPDGEGEAALYAQSNGANEILIYEGAGSESWSNYVYDVVIEPGDNDTIGTVFYYQDADTFYQLTMNQQEDTRTLTKVENGTETVLATETASYRHYAMQDLRIAVLDGEITITLDDELLFGGPVTDAEPLTGGTVGVVSQFMDRALFDNIAVNPVGLAAKALTSAPAGRWVADRDGDGLATVELTAAASLSAEGIATYEWLVDGSVVATGETAALDLRPGETTVTLRVTDTTGAISEDPITVTVADRGAILVDDDFADGDFAGWTIVDQGTQDGPSDWQVVGGALVEASNINSPQQGTGSSAYSVEGDGPFILRDGTYALWDDPAALDWTDYAIEATLTPNDDDGIGLLLRYVDPQNYYKLEADAQTGLVMLTRHLEGRETILARAYGDYTPGESQHWRIEARDGVITPYIDGKKVFGTEIEDRTLPAGTVGLYSWASSDLAFDDVLVAELVAIPDLEVTLIDADTDAAIATLGPDGSEIPLSLILGRDVTIAAVVRDESPFAAEIESVRLDLNDGERTVVESVEPYALFGDDIVDGVSDFFGEADVFGETNSIEFELYSADGARGTLLDTVSRSFTVVDDIAPTAEDLRVVLIDADTDSEIATLEADGTEIPLSQILGKDVTIAATIREGSQLAGLVESVSLDLNDGERTIIQNTEPFALFGDDIIDGEPDYFGDEDVFSETNGIDFALYSEDDAEGTLLDTITRSFTVVDDIAPMAEDLRIVLVDADTDSEIATLSDGAQIDRGLIDGRELSIAVFVTDNILFDLTESALLTLNGSVSRIENVGPYTLFGDEATQSGVDYEGETDILGDGVNTFDVEFFDEARGRGESLGTVSLDITVIDDLG